MVISDFSIIIIIIVIISIIIGMVITMLKFCNIKKISTNKYPPITGTNEKRDEYFEDLSAYPDQDTDLNVYTGGDTKLVVIDDVRGCIDKLNKNGLINDILNKTFEPLLYVRDITERLKYEPSCSYYISQHVGQLKLLIGEIHFCTIANTLHTDSFTLVYAGSAPNHKGFILNKLFPNMKAILIDPAEHLLYKSNNGSHYDVPNDTVLYFCCANTNKFNIHKRIVNIFDGIKIQKLNRDSIEVKTISDKWRSGTYIDNMYLDIIKHIISGDIGYNTYNNIIIEDYFKDDTAEFCKKIPNIIFASDIRTNAHDMLKLNTFGKKDITDLDICVNSAMMLSWLNIMKPRLSMLKFRPPYYMYKEKAIFENNCNSGMYKYYFDKVKHQVDFIADYKKKQFRYIVGDEIIQSYAGTTSGETRLIFTDVKIELYDHLKREENLFYYNQIRRQYGFHVSTPDTISGVDQCGDCSLAQKIISDYLSKYSINNPNITINNMISLLRRSIGNSTHGYFISMNTIIENIYSIQSYILLNIFMKSLYKTLIPNSIDIDVEKRYQLRYVLGLENIIFDLIEKYMVNKSNNQSAYFYHVLMRYLTGKSTWVDKLNIIYKYTLYELTSKQGLTKLNATNLLNKLNNIYDKIQNNDYSNKANIDIDTYETKITVKYRDYSVDISKDWYYIDDMMLNKEIYLNAIMYEYDSRISTGSFINIPDIIYDIINMTEYTNLYEISLGLHDILFHNSPIDMNIEHFTHINCNIKTIKDLKNIPPKTIIIAFYYMSKIFSDYMTHVIRAADTIIIFITLDHLGHKTYIIGGYRIQTPHIGFNFMKTKTITDINLNGFHFTGPPDKIYAIKHYYEQTKQFK